MLILFLTQYMRKAIKNLLFLVFNVVLVFCIDLKQFKDPPAPYCQSRLILQQFFPISGGEVQSIDLDDYFFGYNLSITLSNQPTFTYLKPKMSTVKETKMAQVGLKSHQIEVEGTTTTIITLSIEGNASIIRWGITNAKDNHLPALNGFMIVEADPSIICFDAVWMWKDQTAIVDCSITQNQVTKNIFIVVDIVSRTVLKTINNPLDISSKEASNRKLKLFYQNSKRYVFRAYLTIDDMLTDTYAQVWSFENLLLPTLKCKIDSVFMDTFSFAIRDFQVDQSTIYILDYFQGVTRFSVSKKGEVTVQEQFTCKYYYRKLGVFNTSLGNRRVMALGGDNFVQEYDWSQNQPRKINNYIVPKGKWLNLKMNEQFLMIQTSPIDSSQMTYIYRRGKSDLQTAHAAILHNEFTLTTFVSDKSSLIIITQTNMVERVFDFSILLINPIDKQVAQYNVVAIATSLNEQSYSIKCTLTLKLLKVSPDELKLFSSGYQLPSPYDTAYPGKTFVPLSDLILGGNMTYGVSVDPKYGPTPSSYILKQNSSRFIWNNSKLSFSLFYQIELTQLEYLQFFLISQEKSNITRFTLCQQDYQAGSITCDNDQTITSIQSRIISLAATVIYDADFLKIVAIAKEDTPNKVIFFDVSTGKQLNYTSIVLGVDQKVIDMAIMLKEQLVVGISKNGQSEIAIFDLRSCLIKKTNCKQFLRLDKEWVSSSGLKIFQIHDLITTELHPNLLFIASVRSVVIVEIGKNGGIVYAQIISPATTTQKWKATVGKSSLIISNTLLIEQFDLSNIYINFQIFLMKQFPLYQYKIANPDNMVTSTEGNMTFILATDPNLSADSNSVILIYEHQKPAVLSFFDVYKLETNSTDHLLSTITLNVQNLITVVLGNEIKVVRSIQQPQIVFDEWPTDYRVNITYTNDKDNRFKYMKELNVHIKQQSQSRYLNLNTD